MIPTYTKILYEKKKKVEKFLIFDLIRKEHGYAFIDELYFYERNETLFKYDYVSYKNIPHKRILKWIGRVVDYQFNLVANDLQATYYNGLKTATTYITDICKYFRWRRKAHPLFIFTLLNKRLIDVLPKQKSYQNMIGSNIAFRIIQYLTIQSEHGLVIRHHLTYFKEIIYDFVSKIYSFICVNILRLKHLAWIRGTLSSRRKRRRFRKYRKFTLFGFQFKFHKPARRKRKLKYKKRT